MQEARAVFRRAGRRPGVRRRARHHADLRAGRRAPGHHRGPAGAGHRSRAVPEVTGGAPLASPGLVWDVAIGQSTVVTQHVKANLFYRGLAFRRAPRLGDTLRTSTEVVALRQNQPREGRAPTGLAVLRITTADQERRPVLDFWRCAMLPLRDQDRQTGHADELDSVGQRLTRRPQRAGQRLAAGRSPTGRGTAPGRTAGRPELGRAGRRRGLQRAGAGPADPQRGDGRITTRRPPAAGGWCTAGTPSGWRWPRRPARCPPWSRWRPGTAATTSARSTRATRCAARSRSSRSIRSRTAAAWSTCAPWSGPRRPGQTAGSAGPRRHLAERARLARRGSGTQRRIRAARRPGLALHRRRRLIPGAPHHGPFRQKDLEDRSGRASRRAARTTLARRRACSAGSWSSAPVSMRAS